MTKADDIRAEVERRVAGALIPRLLVALETQHAQHGWKTGCECNFCQIRRRGAGPWPYLDREASLNLYRARLQTLRQSETWPNAKQERDHG